jgi:hypothetical protein
VSDHQYKTTDVSVSAFLVARGHKLLDIEGDNPAKRMFVFPEAARADVPKFFTDAPVGARTFAAALKSLKSAVHAGR